MTTWPILSVITFLPLVGALFILVVRGDEAVTRAQRTLGRALDHACHVRCVAPAAARV